MKYGFIKVASATPKIRVADCKTNTINIIEQIKEAHKNGASLVVFPELCVTGYTCSDLFYQRVLLNAAEKSVEKILKETADLDIISIAGVPVAIESALYNCAAVIYKGDILGIVPKVNIPNYSEFYEVRHYTSGKNLYDEISYAGVETIISDNLVFCCDKMRDFSFGVEVCEDLWVAESPSVEHAKHGATIICNPSTSDDVIGKAQYRRDLVKMQSGKLCCIYLQRFGLWRKHNGYGIFGTEHNLRKRISACRKQALYNRHYLCRY